MRPPWIWWAALALGGTACTRTPPTPPAPATLARLSNVGPRVLSNASAYPVMLYGENLPAGARLRIRAQPPVEVPTHWVDPGHLSALIPEGLGITAELSSARVQLSLRTTEGATIAGSAGFTVVNDLAFRTPYALAAQEGPGLGWVVYRSTDELRAVVGEGRVSVGDRPRAIKAWGRRWVVADEGGDLRVLDGSASRTIPLPADAIDLSIDDEKGLAYVSSFAQDRILVVDLNAGAVVRTLPAGVNPRASALAEGGKRLVVGNYQSQDVSVLNLDDGTETRLRPGPGIPILGGRTEKYSAFVMGSTPPRAVVASERLHVAFVASNGPNVGPNPDRMEVTENGGVGVLELNPPRWARHVSMLTGVPDALALDEARGLLYVADSSTGRVVVFDAKRLAKSDDAARQALLGAFDLPVPEGVSLVRPEADFGVSGRASPSLHFGPIALALHKGGQQLLVLSRYTGAVANLDLAGAPRGKLRLLQVYPGPAPSVQTERRQGEVLYYSDVGNSGMTCDTCHPEGNSGGIMFTKGRPIRIYRGHTVRSIRESAPYFTPTRLPSIKRTMTDVLARNRFHNPDPSPSEVAAGTEFVGTIAAPPNPFYAKDGSLPEKVVLPDGTEGAPKRGLGLFEGKAGCAQAECHPPPHFTGDQSPETRGRLAQLGTPMALMLRPEHQDLQKNFGQPPPSLLGLWDLFPLFLSGAGGNEVQPDGTIAATHPFAARWVLENPAWKPHGSVVPLSPEELNDLLAYLYTL